MSDTIHLEGKEFVSAKRASETSGYARDYIGQLARSGLIAAQRVGGLWYVSLESLTEYQKNADSYVPVQPQKQPQDLDSIVSFDGKDYVSASKAAKLTSYNQDYIGQLARAGKILSRQIGNRWYVERVGLLVHKAQKDALLGAVQAEAVGLLRSGPPSRYLDEYKVAPQHEPEGIMKYTQETDDLMPVLQKGIPAEDTIDVRNDASHAVPIHVVRAPQRRRAGAARNIRTPVRARGITMITAAKAGVALTFVIVLSYGLVSLKDNSLYTTNATEDAKSRGRGALTANLGGIVDWVTSNIEQLISPQVDYVRTP